MSVKGVIGCQGSQQQVYTNPGGSGSFILVLIHIGERERFVWGQQLHYEGNQTLPGVNNMKYERTNVLLILRKVLCLGKCEDIVLVE